MITSMKRRGEEQRGEKNGRRDGDEEKKMDKTKEMK